tara:strand:+ start:602 stop:769 length:168 start_codon:yes stop_codon:yes gene_type:complete
VPKVRRPNPATNISKAVILYLVASDPRLSKKVSAAKELISGFVFWIDFFLAEENI